jgi:RecB family exonuclease
MVSDHRVLPQGDAANQETSGDAAPLALSHSQIEMFAQCPLRWWFAKRAETPRAPSEPLLLGNAIHQAIEADIRHKMSDAASIEKADLVDIFATALAQQCEQDDPLHLVSSERRLVLAQQGRDILDVYCAVVSSRLNPIAVEVPFEFVHPVDGSIVFRGRIDAVTLSADEPPIRTIIDWKTTQRRWPVGAEHRRQQAAAYRWAEHCMQWPPSQRVTFVTFPPREPMKDDAAPRMVDPRPTSPSDDALRAYAQLVQRTAAQVRAMDAAHHFPHRASSRCAWCEVRGACQAGQAYLANNGITPRTPTLPS